MRIFLIVGIILLLLLQYNLWFSHNGLISAHHLKTHIEAQKADNKKVEQQNSQLSSDIKALKQNSSVIATKARNNFGMIHKGDTYYDIVGTTKHDNNSSL